MRYASPSFKGFLPLPLPFPHDVPVRYTNCFLLLKSTVPRTKRANHTHENPPNWRLGHQDRNLHASARPEGVRDHGPVQEGDREGRHHHPPRHHQDSLEEAVVICAACPRVWMVGCVLVHRVIESRLWSG